MNILPIKTKIFQLPQDDLLAVLDDSLTDIAENDIVVITSKVLAIHQGRVIKITNDVDKDALTKQEADKWLARDVTPDSLVMHTIKNHTLIPSAGIDESNGDGYYILWPEKINESAKEICDYLKQKHTIKNLAVVITDSHSLPLRYGTVGIAIGFFGIHPLKDYVDEKDLYGRPYKMQRQNLVDGIAAAAVYTMGEGSECTPIAIVRDAKDVTFTNQHTFDELIIPPQEDLFYPFLKIFDEKDDTLT